MQCPFPGWTFLSFERVSFGWLLVGDGSQQVANKQVQDGLTMADPNMEGLGLGGKAGFGFESGAPKRNPPAAKVKGISNDGMQQSQIDRDAGTAFAVEAN